MEFYNESLYRKKKNKRRYLYFKALFVIYLYLFCKNGKILHLLTLGRGDPDSGEIQNNFEFSRSEFPCVCKINCLNSLNYTFFQIFLPLYAYTLDDNSKIFV